MQRLMELAREWKLPIAFMKLDISKAFDSLGRQALLRRLHDRLGDTAGFFCVQNLLCDVVVTVQSPWGCSEVPVLSGIKQGASESPLLFGVVKADSYIYAPKPELLETDLRPTPTFVTGSF